MYFFRTLPMECTFWHDKKRESLQVGQIVILVSSKDDHHNISNAKICRISRKMKRKYRKFTNHEYKTYHEYIFRYQDINVENGTLKGTDSKIFNSLHIRWNTCICTYLLRGTLDGVITYDS